MDGNHIADLCTDKDVHILVVNAVKCTHGRAPLDPHIEISFNARIRSRYGFRTTCSKKGRQTRDTAPDRLAVNAMNDLFRGKRIQHIRHIGRQVPLLLVEAYGRRHRIACDLDGKGNDRILLPLLRPRLQFCLNPVRCTDKTGELNDVVIRNLCILKTLSQHGQFNNGTFAFLRIDGEIISIRLDDELKPLAQPSNGSFHNITPDLSKLHLYFNYLHEDRVHHSSSFIRASVPRIRKIAFVCSCEMRASDRCRIAAISLSVISS